MSKWFALLMLSLFVSGLPAAGDPLNDPLDDALNKHKDRAKRRVYSQPAALSDQDLAIPKTPTEEDRALDRKIEELERALDKQAALNPVPIRATPAPMVPMVPNEETQNWLTPALLDEDAAMNTDEEETWLARELERQNQKRVEQDEQTLLEKKMADGIRPAQYDIQNKYDFPERNRPSKNIYERPSYLTERAPMKAPTAEASGQASTPTSSTMFSPTDYRGSSIATEPFSTSIKPTIRPEQNRPRQSSAIDWETPTSQPRTPLNRVRQSSPIHKKDPFSEDFMPRIKTSIWD
jgi:hypothetical protein